MSQEVLVRAGWALWTKHPGSTRDYAVLESSRDPLTDQEFAGALAYFAPGNPTTELGQPGSLPWVTISQVRIEQQRYMGMAIQKDAKQVDGAGRPIIRTSYFCIPHTELTANPISYAKLYEVLKDVWLPPERDGLIQLSIPRLDLEDLATKIIDTYGEQAVRATAALLLSGSVSIVGAEGSTVKERLDDLDAVAAMLPNGYRTDFTAATWSDSATRHHIRLAFAARARDGAGFVRWHSAPAEAGGDGPADSYLSLLRQIRQRRAARQDLVDLLTFLADDTTPRAFDEPQYAVDRVRDFDFAFIVWNAVRNGTAEVADVRTVFDRSRITELPPQGRQDLLEFLIDHAETQDWPHVGKWWDAVVDGDPGVMLPALVRISRHLFWTPSPNPAAIREPLTLADKHGLLDGLLAELIVAPDSRSLQGSALSAAAQSLIDWVLASPSAFPRTQQAMASSQMVACELLALLATSRGGDTRAGVRFLEPVLRGFLHPFFVALGGIDETVDQFGFGQLARQGTECVRALLQTASACGRLPQVLPGFAAWLASSARGPADDGTGQDWPVIISKLVPRDVISQAWLDVALLISGGAPSPWYLLTDLDRNDRQRYNECLARAWSELANTNGPALDDLLAQTLGGSLAETRGRATIGQADAVVDLTIRLNGGGKGGQLQAIVASWLATVPETARSEAACKWLAAVQHSRPDVVQDGALAALRRPPRGVSAAELAKRCVQAQQNGLDMREACEALADSRTISTGRKAAAVLAELRQGLRVEQADERQARDWVRWFTARFADGTFGSEVAAEFRSLAVAHARAEIRYCLDELFIAATGGREYSPPELSIEDITDLEGISRSSDQIARDAKRRRSRWHRGDKQDRGEEGQHDGGTGGPGGGPRHGSNQDCAGQPG